MSLNPKWVPMKWQCGPSEMERLRVDENRNVEFEKSATRWADPSALKLLKGSPINCLVVDWASGAQPLDGAHQSALKPLIQAGRQMGLSFVGRVSTKDNLAFVVEAGRAAGLEAVVLEEVPDEKNLALPFIVPYPNDNLGWSDVTEIYRGMGATWPGADLQGHDDNSAVGGPTGVPMTRSNGWFSLMSREIAPGKTPWLDVDPPASARILPVAEYCRVIADCRVYGSHWVVSLDPWLRKDLLDEVQGAVETWTRITGQITFFETHAEWAGYSPMGVLGVVSDFAGLNAISSGDLLNFLNGSQTQFLALERVHMAARAESGLKGMVWMDDASPSDTQREQVIQFVQSGGVVIAPKYWGPTEVTPADEDWIPEYSLYALGKGRIVVAKGGILDPYQLSRYAHILIGRKNDFARLFNPQMTTCYSSLHPDGHRQIVHLVNYGPKPVEYMSLWVNGSVKAATLMSTEQKSPLALECFPSTDGTEFHLPTLTVHGTVELERSA